MSFDYDRSWAAAPLYYRAPSPPGIVPREYQFAGAEYALARKHCLIGDAPGVGKTGQAILISNAIEAKRTLVVCPASLRLNWEREIWRWSMIPNVRTYPVLKARDGVSPHAHYLILSYDLLRNLDLLRAILDLHWDHLILDEAHYLKDPKRNSRTRPVCEPDLLPSVVGRITMLSGTILPNQPIECYNAVRLLDWGAIDRMSLDKFRDRYYERGSGFVTGHHLTKDKKGNPVWKVGPYWSDKVRNQPRNLDELRVRLRERIMIRRLKKDVLPELPERQWKLVPLESNAGIRRALKHPGWKMVEQLYDLDPGSFDESIPIDGAISTARRELGEAKVKGALAYIEELLREGVEKLVVGAWHHSVLAVLREGLEKYGMAYMDGKTSSVRRQAEVDRFQGDPGCRVILGQMGPLGLGWTLTAAQDVVLAEPDWVPGNNNQLLDRVHRFGQDGNRVLGHILIVPDTIDERIVGRAVEKDKITTEALDGLD